MTARSGTVTVQIYGQKRVGTNAIEALLRRLPVTVLVNERVWKHGYPRPVADCHVCIGKAPLAWQYSNMRYTDPPGEETWDIHGYFARENAYLVWCEQRNDAMYVPYEDLLLRPSDRWRELCGFLGEPGRGFSWPGLPPNRMDRNGRETGEPFDAAFWRGYRYLRRLGPRVVAMVSDCAYGHAALLARLTTECRAGAGGEA